MTYVPHFWLRASVNAPPIFPPSSKISGPHGHSCHHVHFTSDCALSFWSCAVTSWRENWIKIASLLPLPLAKSHLREEKIPLRAEIGDMSPTNWTHVYCLALNVIGLSSTWLRTRWRASKSRSTWWSPWATTSTTRTPASTTGTWTRQCPRFLSC